MLDTNVVSEASRPRPSARVLGWIRSQPPTSLLITTITQGESLFGVAILPLGQRRQLLEAAVDGIIEGDFRDRVLPFDSAAAREYAEIAASRRRSGRPISEPDGRIAAITRSRGASLATRNTGDFFDCGIELVDPWR